MRKNISRRHRNRTIWVLIYLSILLFPFANVRSSEKQNVVHHGYAQVDRLLDCIHKVYGKIAVRDPSVRGVQFKSCPQTREELLALLKNDELRLYEAGNWIYVLGPRYYRPALPNFKGPEWNRVRIVPRINPYKDEGFSDKEQDTIAEQVFREARMIPLYAIDHESKDEITLKFDMKFCRTKLRPDASDSILLMLEQVIDQVPDRGSSVGRLVCGKMVNGEFKILWDSRLFVGHAVVHFEDVDGDGWQEIVVESVTGGVFEYPIWTIFDRNGREITRQKKCDTTIRPFTEEDGVCDLSGIDISFSGSLQGPKEIIVAKDRGKRIVFKLQNGMYVPETLRSVPR